MDGDGERSIEREGRNVPDRSNQAACRYPRDSE